MWLSDEGLCSVCYYDKHKWEKQNLHHYAVCMICYGDVIAPSLDDILCLWADDGYSGKPVCFECSDILKGLVPEKLKISFEKKLDQDTKKNKKKKIGLDKWLES